MLCKRLEALTVIRTREGAPREHILCEDATDDHEEKEDYRYDDAVRERVIQDVCQHLHQLKCKQKLKYVIKTQCM